MKIGKRASAQKYKELRALQARVNNMLYKSTHIEKTNGKRKQVLAMKRQFYKSRGIKNPSRLSFSVLSTKDIKAYTELLKSIENNTFINPQKYKEYQKKMRDKFDSYGYNFSYEDVRRLLDSEIIQELINEGLTPSEFWQIYNEITTDYSDIDEEQFFYMATDFLQEIKYGDATINEFFVYADEWFSKRANETNGNLYE